MAVSYVCSPLGPFVPAPPEVAMRMFRDQGGPPPFEGGGRNGRPGCQLSGPAPILLSPAFRQDPRRIRRYFCWESFELKFIFIGVRVRALLCCVFLLGCTHFEYA